MVAGLESGLSLEDAFQQAVASGTATAFTEDLATIEDIEKLNHRLLLQYLMGVKLMRITELLTKIQLLWIYQRLIKMVSLMN